MLSTQSRFPIQEWILLIHLRYFVLSLDVFIFKNLNIFIKIRLLSYHDSMKLYREYYTLNSEIWFKQISKLSGATLLCLHVESVLSAKEMSVMLYQLIEL